MREQLTAPVCKVHKLNICGGVNVRVPERGRDGRCMLGRVPAPSAFRPIVQPPAIRRGGGGRPVSVRTAKSVVRWPNGCWRW